MSAKGQGQAKHAAGEEQWIATALPSATRVIPPSRIRLSLDPRSVITEDQSKQISREQFLPCLVRLVTICAAEADAPAPDALR
jgi:hypothetical protein